MSSDPPKLPGPLGISNQAFPVALVLAGGMPPNCPPPSAVYGPKELYRLVKHDPPIHDDFLTCAEAGKHQDRDPCIRHSISTFNSKKNAEKLRQGIPFFRLSKIASGVVPPNGGAMRRTLSSAGHWSWWPAKGYARHSTFKVVA